MSQQIFPPPFFDQFNRLAIRYQLQTQGSQITPEDAQILENKQARLQKLIDMFSHQSDAFILHQWMTATQLYLWMTIPSMTGLMILMTPEFRSPRNLLTPDSIIGNM